MISDIIADIDDTIREVVLTIHWQDGQHSQLRVRKPGTGEHGCQTSGQALAVIERMATRYSDTDTAATLNRMGVRTGWNKTWTAHRVGSIRRVRGIRAFRSVEKDGAWLTMRETTVKLGVISHVVQRMIKDGTLPAEHVVPGAPFQMRTKELERKCVVKALGHKLGPRHASDRNQL